MQQQRGGVQHMYARRISLIEVSAWEKRGWVRVNVWVEEERHSIHFIHHRCAHLTDWVTLFTFLSPD